MEKPRRQDHQPAHPEEFQDTWSLTRAQLEEQHRALTGGDAEVETLLAKLSDSDPLGLNRIQLEGLGITGRNILTAYELAGRSPENFHDLLAAAYAPGNAISASDLIAAIDRVERGEEAGIDVPAIIAAYRTPNEED